MRPYFAIFKARLFILFRYRAAAFAGIVTQVFWGLLKIMIFSSLFKINSSLQIPVSLSQTITLIWLAQAFLQLVPWNIDREVQAQIKNGNVITELLRPLNLYFLYFSRALSMRIIPVLLRSLPLLLIAYFFFDLSLPVSFKATFFFFLSLIFSVFLSASITTLIMSSLFWTIAGDGIIRLTPSLILLCSGVMIPIPLFPDWAKSILEVLPFRAVIDIPGRIYLGLINGNALYESLLFQISWTLFIMILGYFFMKLALRKLVIQGG